MTGDVRIERDLTRLVLGLAIVMAGILFTLDNLGVIHAGSYLKYWPVFLVALGVVKVIQARSWGSYGWSVAWIVVGLWWLAENIGMLSVSIWAMWPLVLVLVGASIIWRACCPPRIRGVAWLRGDSTVDPFEPRGAGGPIDAPAGEPAAGPFSNASGGATANPGARLGDSTVSAFAFWSGVERASASADFRGGDLVAIMGGCELDLRKATIAAREAVIDVTAIMGGIDIVIPETWTVEAKVIPLMGGVGDETRHNAGAPTGRLVIRGVALMGAVQVKN